jgi:OmpA-OmpF porin, OOP family
MINILKRIYLPIFAVILNFCFLAARSQSNVAPSALGVSGFYNIFRNPASQSGENYKSGAAGIAVNYQKGLSRHIVFTSTFSGSILDFVNRNNTDIGNNSKLLFLELDASLRYLIPTGGRILWPYVQAGIGGSSYSIYWGAYVPAGLGVQINITPSSFILLNAQQRFAISSNQDNHYYFSLGLTGNIGKTKQKKQLPTPPPPKDTDGDGIYDIDDACPTIPGFVRYKGCPIPDRDGDGINDEEDSCPAVPGLARYHGCPIPDRDHDGINDEVDHCPDVPGVARYQGCPIPDRDHDGLNDEEDRCPDVPGPISNHGCPLIDSSIAKKIKIAAENCFFETGKYSLLPKSFKSLNEVVNILKSDTSLKLNIEGYTDNQGNSKSNQLLSENRAKSVMNYLLMKGIATQRLSFAGFGETNPVADNSTPEGRAKNRRVEIKIRIF